MSISPVLQCLQEHCFVKVHQNADTGHDSAPSLLMHPKTNGDGTTLVRSMSSFITLNLFVAPLRPKLINVSPCLHCLFPFWIRPVHLILSKAVIHIPTGI